jgi:hypothetical protein
VIRGQSYRQISRRKGVTEGIDPRRTEVSAETPKEKS